MEDMEFCRRIKEDILVQPQKKRRQGERDKVDVKAGKGYFILLVQKKQSRTIRILYLLSPVEIP